MVKDANQTIAFVTKALLKHHNKDKNN